MHGFLLGEFIELKITRDRRSLPMTENEVLEMLLGIKEIQVDRFEVEDQHLHIYCGSIFQEALCPRCL